MKVTLPDGSAIELNEPTALSEIAKSLSGKLAKKAVGAKVNGELKDVSYILQGDAEVKILTAEDPEGLEIVRHSCCHVMAEAICKLFAGTKLVYGPAIENGFYYDIDSHHVITEKDFPEIEKEMERIKRENRPFVRTEMSRGEAAGKVAGNEYKLDNIERATGDVISFYSQGEEFADVCAGPHVARTSQIGFFKLMSVSGAYWHGDASSNQLTRVYGTAWADDKQLKDYLHRLEEAKKRDHRTLNNVLDIFHLDETIGAGLVLWQPNGGMIRHLIESFWKEEHLKRGYQILYTPHIASEEIFKASGHLENYADMMYSPMDIDGQPYRVKPMNCPAHITIYKSKKRSYRELPFRWCELGTVYRYELSGTLLGMFRVRGFTQDDSHIFCTQAMLQDEVMGVLDLMDDMMTVFGYEYKAFLATRPEKYLGTDEEWNWSTAALKQALEQRNMSYEVDEGGGVFYAPKIDIKLVDALGREWQGPTVQVDLNLPKRFKVNYVSADNSPVEAVMIHRTVLGSMERFVGGLIEHYAGDFPLWLAPEQIRVMNITEKQAAYAGGVTETLKQAGLRASADLRNEKINYKVREAIVSHIPYCAVVGDVEVAAGTVSLRHRKKGDLGQISIEELKKNLGAEVAEKRLPLGWKE